MALLFDNPTTSTLDMNYSRMKSALDCSTFEAIIMVWREKHDDEILWFYLSLLTQMKNTHPLIFIPSDTLMLARKTKIILFARLRNT